MKSSNFRATCSQKCSVFSRNGGSWMCFLRMDYDLHPSIQVYVLYVLLCFLLSNMSTLALRTVSGIETSLNSHGTQQASATQALQQARVFAQQTNSSLQRVRTSSAAQRTILVLRNIKNLPMSKPPLFVCRLLGSLRRHARLVHCLMFKSEISCSCRFKLIREKLEQQRDSFFTCLWSCCISIPIFHGSVDLYSAGQRLSGRDFWKLSKQRVRLGQR